LKIAAKVDAADLSYFKTKIEPLLDHPLAERMVRAYLTAYRLLLNGVAATRELMVELPLAPPTMPELSPMA
jgi:hypothetical protein